MSVNIVANSTKLSSNTIELGDTTLSVTSPASARTLTIPDTGSNGSVILNTSQAMTISNNGTVGQLLTVSSTSVALWSSAGGAYNTNPYGLGSSVTYSGNGIGGSGTTIYLIRLYISDVATNYYFMLTS